MESTGLFFMTFQADKCGPQALPPVISLKTYADHIQFSTKSIKSLASEWFTLDNNAVPAHYVLKAANASELSQWKSALPKLRKALHSAKFDLNTCHDLTIGGSLSEWEIKYAIANNNASKNRCFWMHRRFNNITNHTSELEKKWIGQEWVESLVFTKVETFEDYCDTKASLARLQQLESFKNWLNEALPPERIQPFALVTLDAYLQEEEDWDKHMDSYNEEVTLTEKQPSKYQVIQYEPFTEWDAYFREWEEATKSLLLAELYSTVQVIY